MHFTIITPSFNQLDYLKRCVASVGDQAACSVRDYDLGGKGNLKCEVQNLKHEQQAITIHHHVQDACSTDGTREFLAETQLAFSHKSLAVSPDEVEVTKTSSIKPSTAVSGYTFSYESVPDDGMYDAINRGVDVMLGGKREAGPREKPNANSQKITAEDCDSIVAWLNCDEQYLPGTLEKVAMYFSDHPDMDFVYGDALLLDENGKLLTYRKNPPLRKWYVQSDHLYAQSCAMFFRASVFRSRVYFDTAWKAVGDSDFVVRLFKEGFKCGRIDAYLSVFFMTGSNLSGSESGMQELKRWRSTMPLFIRLLHYLLRGMRYFEKWVIGGYREKFPFQYSIYTSGNLQQRKDRLAESGTARFVSWSRK